MGQGEERLQGGTDALGGDGDVHYLDPGDVLKDVYIWKNLTNCTLWLNQFIVYQLHLSKADFARKDAWYSEKVGWEKKQEQWGEGEGVWGKTWRSGALLKQGPSPHFIARTELWLTRLKADRI